MAEISSFFKSVNGDRRYKAEDWAEYFSSFLSSGIFPNPSTNLEVISNNDMTVTIKQGKAWINGYFYYNTDDLVLNLDNADGVLSRIDSIVIQHNKVNREITAQIKKGTFGSSPVAPSLQRDADIYELGIADIYIGNGVVTILQTNITDTRLDNNLCGVVSSLIDIDVSILTNQMQSDFDTWFATIQDTLDGDTAGNLLNLINANTDNVNKKVILTQNVSIQSANWVDDTGTSGFWYYQVTNADVTTTTIININFALADLEKAITQGIQQATDSFAGYYRLYSTDQPTDNFTVDVVKQNGVVA